MRYILVFLISLLFLSLSLKMVVGQQAEPDAVYLEMRKEYILNDDGSITYHYSHKQKLLTNYATSRKYGETSIIYNPKFQKVKVNYSRTKMADGKVIPSPENAYNEVLPSIAVNAPAYNHLRRLVVTHTALEQNAIVEIDYEINTEKDFYPALTGNEIIPQNSPIKELTIVVKTPTSKELKYKLLNSNIVPVIKVEDNQNIYKWTFVVVPGIVSESNMADAADFKPYLIFSTAKDLEETYKKFRLQSAFKYYVDDKIAKYAKELKDNSISELDYVLKVQRFVSKYIRTYNIPLYYAGYQLQPNQDVFYSNGGTLLEKAALMVDLISSVAIFSYPVLVANSKLVDKKIGNLNIFNEVLVKVDLHDGNTVYLPVNKEADKNLKYSLAGKSLIPIDNYRESMNIITEEGVENKLIINSSIKISEDKKITAIVNSEIQGALFPYMKVVKDTNKFLKSMLYKQKNLNKIKINKLNQTTINVDYESDIFSSFKVQDKYLFWDLPQSSLGINSWNLPVFISKRNTPVKLPYPVTEEYNFSIKLPDKISLVSPEVTVDKENELLHIKIEIKKTGDGVTFSRSLIIKKNEISISDYEKFREIMNIWRIEQYKTIIFKEAE